MRSGESKSSLTPPLFRCLALESRVADRSSFPPLPVPTSPPPYLFLAFLHLGCRSAVASVAPDAGITKNTAAVAMRAVSRLPFLGGGGGGIFCRILEPPRPIACPVFFAPTLLLPTHPFSLAASRRAASSSVAKPNSTRAAGAGGSSNTMLKLYTDSGETGLQV